MRIVYAGNFERGITCLEALHNHGQDELTVIAPPLSEIDSKRGSVVTYAQSQGICVLQPENINSPRFISELRQLQPDLLILVGYRQILKKAILAVPRLGCINLHGGRLPDYRGVAPMNWMIINGESKGAVSIIFVDEGIDTGDIIAEANFDIDENDTIQDVVEKTCVLFPPLLITVVDSIRNGTVKRKKQNRNAGSYFTRRYPRDGFIDWKNVDAVQVHNLVRALTAPYPGAFTYYKEKKLFIWKTSLLSKSIRGIAGRVCLNHPRGVIVLARDRGLVVESVQEIGKPVVPAATFFTQMGVDLR